MLERHLFKAKRMDNGEWVFGGLAYCEKNGAYFITKMGKDHISYIGYSQEVDPDTICQCTGLKDKNGNLIWENDIVKINNSEVNALITFRDFEIICTIPREKYYKHRLEHTTEYEVVGNVFDNPELLEE